MSDGDFEQELDRIEMDLDPVGFQDRELVRRVGPILDAAASLIQSAVTGRDMFAAIIEDRVDDRQSAILMGSFAGKSSALVTVCFRATGDGLLVWAEEIPNGPYSLGIGNRHLSVKTADLTEQWIKRTLASILGTLAKR